MISRKQINNLISNRLHDIYTQNWLSEVNNNSQCRNYRIFKNNLKFESYLIELNSFDRINMCKFRCSNSYIPSVQGRYQNIPFHERTCALCQKDKIGDEFHYILECNAFSKDRNTRIKPYYRKRPNGLKFEQLFNTNKLQIAQLSKFCDHIMKFFKP